MCALEKLENLLKEGGNGVSNREELLALHEQAIEDFEDARELETQVQHHHLEVRDAESTTLLKDVWANSRAMGSKLESVSEQLEELGIQLIRRAKSKRIFVERTTNETNYIRALIQFREAVDNAGHDAISMDNIENKRAAMEEAESTVRNEIYQRLISAVKTTDSMESAQKAKARTAGRWNDALVESAQQIEDVLSRIASGNAAAENLEVELLELDAKPNYPRCSRRSIAVFDNLSRFRYVIALRLDELTEARINYESSLRKTDLKAVD